MVQYCTQMMSLQGTRQMLRLIPSLQPPRSKSKFLLNHLLREAFRALPRKQDRENL